MTNNKHWFSFNEGDHEYLVTDPLLLAISGGIALTLAIGAGLLIWAVVT